MGQSVAIEKKLSPFYHHYCLDGDQIFHSPQKGGCHMLHVTCFIFLATEKLQFEKL